MFSPNVRHQYIAALIVSLGTFICGITVGWASTAIPILQSDVSHLHTKLTIDEISWITSIQNIGAIVGTFFFGWVANVLGRKYTLCITTLPGLLSFMLLYFSTEVYQLYIARFMGGLIGGGAYIVVPLYISEIAEAKVRGCLSAGLTLLYNTGILVAFIIGNYFSYFTAVIVYSVFPVIQFISILYIPETPFFLVKHNKLKKAERVYRHFRNIPQDEEITDPTYSAELQDLHNLNIDGNNKNAKLNVADFFNYTAIKAQILGMIVASMNQLCGICALIYYAATIFRESGSNMSPNMSAIVVGVVQLFGTYLATVLVEKAGRKILMVTSCSLCSIILLIFGSYNYLKITGFDLQYYQWIPLTCMGLHIFIASCGPLTLPFIIISEIMPEKIRGFAVTYCIAHTWIMCFVCVKYFYVVTETYGLHVSLIFFSVCCAIGAVLLLFLLPETKGKSFKEIQLLLNKQIL